MQHTPQSNGNLEKSSKPLLGSCCRFKTLFFKSTSESELQNTSVPGSPMKVRFCPELQQGRKGILKTSISTSLPFGLSKYFLSSVFSTFEVAPCLSLHPRTKAKESAQRQDQHKKESKKNTGKEKTKEKQNQNNTMSVCHDYSTPLKRNHKHWCSIIISRAVSTASEPDFVHLPNSAIREYEIIILTPTYPNNCMFTGSSDVCTGGSPPQSELAWDLVLRQDGVKITESAGWQPTFPGIHLIPSKASYIKSNNNN